MNRLIPHIEYLLSCHDCVIIPSFGGFIANYEPSYIDGSVINPPSRKISFNKDLSHNDGLLVNSVSRKLSMSYSAALSVVNEAIDDMRFHLNADREVSVGTIGKLSLGKEKTINFTESSTSHRADFYSVLRPIKLAPLVSESKSSDISENHEVETATSSQKMSVMRNVIRAAASIVLLVFIGFAVLTTNDIDTGKLFQASLIPSETKSFVLNTPPDIELLIAQPSANPAVVDKNVAIAQLNDDKSEVVNKANFPADFEPNYVEDPSPDKHYLIVASMPSLRRAKMFINQKKDSRLGVVKMGKRYRVFAAVAYSEDEVVKLKSDPEFDKKYPKAWPTHAD